MKTLTVNAEKLRDQMQKMGFSQSSLARAVGVDQTTIAKLLTGKSLNSKHLPVISRLLETTTSYLTDETDDPVLGALPIPTPALIAEQLDAMQIAEVDLRLGMGGFGEIDEYAEQIYRAIPTSWVRSFTPAPASKLFLFRGMGDSMFPTIQNADIALIDTSQKALSLNDQIWAITYYGGGQIKRLRKYQGGYKIMSDNSVVSDEIAMDGELSIIGRVVAIWREV